MAGLTKTSSSKPTSRSKATAVDTPATSHPSYEHMIIEAVGTEGKDGGASKADIKKYIVAKYPGATDVEASLTAAIKAGTESGTFTKGAGGKVVIPASGEAEKENDKTAVKEKVAPVKKEAAPKKEKVVKEKKVIAKVAATRKVPSRSSGKVSYNEDIEVVEEPKIPFKKPKAAAPRKAAAAPVKKAVAAVKKAVAAPAKKVKAAIVKAKADLSSKVKEAKKVTKTSVAKKSIAPKAKSATLAKRSSSRK